MYVKIVQVWSEKKIWFNVILIVHTSIIQSNLDHVGLLCKCSLWEIQISWWAGVQNEYTATSAAFLRRIVRNVQNGKLNLRQKQMWEK